MSEDLEATLVTHRFGKTGMGLHDSGRKFQVFISSTQRDLIDERRNVIEAILAMNHIPVGMELFEAGNEDQWTYIKNRILEVDYYIVIVAEHYGSLGPDGLSYTEMEYRFALEHNVPVAALLLHESRRSELPAAKVDFANREKLQNFRALCEKRMVDYWTDSGILISKCQRALGGLIRRHPRAGWVNGDQALRPEVLLELARLSKENSELKSQLASIRENSTDKYLTEAVERISLTFSEILASALRSKTINEDTLERSAPFLKKTTLFDFISDDLIVFFDGIDSFLLQSRITQYISSNTINYKHHIDSISISILSQMISMALRSYGILESYNVPGRDGNSESWLKLSDMGRKAVNECAKARYRDLDPD